ncbi:MAG TPA: hypothetical protein VF526_15940 [Solirubrobacteraceae bacterium]|jgi:Spy/CpxP family protein refolding chaperone
MHSKIRTTIIGAIAACGLAAATVPAVSQAAIPVPPPHGGHGGHGNPLPEPNCGPFVC